LFLAPDPLAAEFSKYLAECLLRAHAHTLPLTRALAWQARTGRNCDLRLSHLCYRASLPESGPCDERCELRMQVQLVEQMDPVMDRLLETAQEVFIATG
jgi:hypothetical protein